MSSDLSVVQPSHHSLPHIPHQYNCYIQRHLHHHPRPATKRESHTSLPGTELTLALGSARGYALVDGMGEQQYPQSYATEVGDANASALEVIPHRRLVPARLNFLVTPSYDNPQSPCGSCSIPSTASTVSFPSIESPTVAHVVTEDGESTVGDMEMEMMYYPIPYKCQAGKEAEHHVSFPCEYVHVLGYEQ